MNKQIAWTSTHLIKSRPSLLLATAAEQSQPGFVAGQALRQDRGTIILRCGVDSSCGPASSDDDTLAESEPDIREHRNRRQ
jgi:hypothetical protein